ncbi:hypothetical protein HZS55_13405 [Halosimplex rubrum]|uniref:Uncharacterized protein n=1 Tax=Halosimplex rubrum TaxID=869889 RepID=A0A7D5P638_9EURY|nr:hypothetical protein [Halosimplex rubrum]QLH78242.1 hypothetical protein HZS55_13405 [Halosimplex rubrum]
MIEWLGGPTHVVDIAIPASGLVLLLVLSKTAETNRSRRYFVPAFGCWLGSELLLGLYAGTLLAVPRPVGIGGALALLVGFLGLFVQGLRSVWNARGSASASP